MKKYLIGLILFFASTTFGAFNMVDCQFIKKDTGEWVLDDLGYSSTDKVFEGGLSMTLASLTVGNIFFGGYQTIAFLDVDRGLRPIVTHHFCGNNIFCSIGGVGSAIAHEQKIVSEGTYVTFDASLGNVADNYKVVYYMPTATEQNTVGSSYRPICERIRGEMKLPSVNKSGDSKTDPVILKLREIQAEIIDSENRLQVASSAFNQAKEILSLTPTDCNTGLLQADRSANKLADFVASWPNYGTSWGYVDDTKRCKKINVDSEESLKAKQDAIFECIERGNIQCDIGRMEITKGSVSCVITVRASPVSNENNMYEQVKSAMNFTIEARNFFVGGKCQDGLSNLRTAYNKIIQYP